MYSYEIFMITMDIYASRKAIQPEDIEQTAPSWTIINLDYIYKATENYSGIVRNYIIVYGLMTKILEFNIK